MRAKFVNESLFDLFNREKREYAKKLIKDLESKKDVNMADIRNALRYGPNTAKTNKQKEEAIDAFKKLARVGGEVHLTTQGLTIKSAPNRVYGINIKKNTLMFPGGSIMHLTKEEARDLYDGVLKNSFE